MMTFQYRLNLFWTLLVDSYFFDWSTALLYEYVFKTKQQQQQPLVKRCSQWSWCTHKDIPSSVIHISLTCQFSLASFFFHNPISGYNCHQVFLRFNPKTTHVHSFTGTRTPYVSPCEWYQTTRTCSSVCISWMSIWYCCTEFDRGRRGNTWPWVLVMPIKCTPHYNSGDGYHGTVLFE